MDNYFSLIKRGTMDLREYLFKERIKIVTFAKQINYDVTYINKICLGMYYPGKKLARIIEDATNGEVVYEYAESKKD